MLFPPAIVVKTIAVAMDEINGPHETLPGNPPPCVLTSRLADDSSSTLPAPELPAGKLKSFPKWPASRKDRQTDDLRAHMASRNYRQVAPTVARIYALLAFSFVPVPASGQTAAADKVPRFERDVLPILTEHCLKCHGGTTRKGGLDLRSPASMFRGGTSGPALVVASTEKS